MHIHWTQNTGEQAQTIGAEGIEKTMEHGRTRSSMGRGGLFTFKYITSGWFSLQSSAQSCICPTSPIRQAFQRSLILNMTHNCFCLSCAAVYCNFSSLLQLLELEWQFAGYVLIIMMLYLYLTTAYSCFKFQFLVSRSRWRPSCVSAEPSRCRWCWAFCS